LKRWNNFFGSIFTAENVSAKSRVRNK